SPSLTLRVCTNTLGSRQGITSQAAGGNSLSSRAKRGICFLQNAKKKQIPRPVQKTNGPRNDIYGVFPQPVHAPRPAFFRSYAATRRHAFYCLTGKLASRSRFNSSTFTRASPRMPHCRCCVCRATNGRRVSTLIPLTRAIRGIWNSAAAGEISGSSPDPDAVTRSAGIATPGFSFCNFATSCFTRSTSCWFVGPKFEPDDAVGSYPVPAAEGREWKYLFEVKGCPMSRDPRIWPFFSIRLPFACFGKNKWLNPVTASG